MHETKLYCKVLMYLLYQMHKWFNDKSLNSNTLLKDNNKRRYLNNLSNKRKISNKRKQMWVVYHYLNNRLHNSRSNRYFVLDIFFFKKYFLYYVFISHFI